MSEAHSSYKIIVGDWSGDGHGKTQEFTVVFQNDVSQEELQATFEKNILTIGFDPRNVCVDYEDNVLPQSLVDLLKNHGLVFDDTNEEDEFEILDDGISLYAETYFCILMHFYTYGTDREWSLDTSPTLFGTWGPQGGGYGLFV